ncbi:unnamed protein product [Cunninghamella blakesleeana]
MDSFPNEVLENIFLLLSHRNLAQVSLVNKKLYVITRQPIFYETLTFHTTQQWNKYIEMINTTTATTTVTTTIKNNQPINHLVKIPYINSFLREYDIDSNKIDIHLFCITFPNIDFIDTIPSVGTPYWPLLTTIPYYIMINNKQWHHDNNNNNESPSSSTTIKKKTTSLQFVVRYKNMPYISTYQPKYEPLTCFKRNGYKTKRKLTDHPFME